MMKIFPHPRYLSVKPGEKAEGRSLCGSEETQTQNKKYREVLYRDAKLPSLRCYILGLTHLSVCLSVCIPDRRKDFSETICASSD